MGKGVRGGGAGGAGQGVRMATSRLQRSSKVSGGPSPRPLAPRRARTRSVDTEHLSCPTCRLSSQPPRRSSSSRRAARARSAPRSTPRPPSRSRPSRIGCRPSRPRRITSKTCPSCRPTPASGSTPPPVRTRLSRPRTRRHTRCSSTPHPGRSGEGWQIWIERRGAGERRSGSSWRDGFMPLL